MLIDPIRILILGGTVEARLLAAHLEGDARISPLTSLAGVTRKPSRIAGQVRTGGFGGMEGLRDFILADHIVMVVDATHPFATQISAHAEQAGAQAGVPILRLERPPWKQQAGDDWVQVADIKEAARVIPEGAHVLVTVGRQEVAPFFARDDARIVARMIEPPDVQVPYHAELCLARPPFTREQEKALMQDKRITMLVAKNSGGETTRPKIEAARDLGLPVIIISRPEKSSLPTASSVDGMMALIEQNLA
jgi:precorrin-6A/cobalt-precorrin-6A reductase